MLRSFLIYLSKAPWAQKLVMNWSVARRTALRFVAGEKLQDAIEAVKALNQQSMLATLDHLGESVTTEQEADRATQDILSTLDAIETSGVTANVSLKLTQLGLTLDEDLCAENLRRVLEHARRLANFVRIDMEDSPCVEPTLRLYWKARREGGFDNVGMVIQSYLYRSERDTHDLLRENTRIRLVKGAYDEPLEVAFQKKGDVNANFDNLTAMLMDCALDADAPALSGDGRFPPIPGIATHDEKRIQYAKDYARRIGLTKGKYEFQFLYGIRRNLQVELVAEGYPVRIYIPYGTQWYPYLMRRLAERPANLWFFLSNLFRG